MAKQPYRPSGFGRLNPIVTMLWASCEKREAFMLSRVSMKTTIGFLGILGIICSAFAQQAPREQGTAAGGGEARPRPTVAPLFVKVEWGRPPSQVDTKVRYTPVPENVSDPN